MTGFELQTSGIGTDRSANRASAAFRYWNLQCSYCQDKETYKLGITKKLTPFM